MNASGPVYRFSNPHPGGISGCPSPLPEYALSLANAWNGKTGSLEEFLYELNCRSLHDGGTAAVQVLGVNGTVRTSIILAMPHLESVRGGMNVWRVIDLAPLEDESWRR